MKVKQRVKKKITEAIAARIRELRQRKGMSQETLCAAIGAEKSYITNIERGHRCPSVYGLFVIANALDCTLQEFANFNIE